MLGKFTRDGLTLCVYSTLYMDYGLLITNAEEEVLFCHPHALSHESYGFKPNPAHGLDWEEAEAAERDGNITVDGKILTVNGEVISAFVPFTEGDWEEMLENEFDELVECFLPE